MNFRNSIKICNRRLFSTSNILKNQIRVRFAPSPTGNIHLGGLRTAFYNYIFARQNNGAFILRIEDTDQTRIVPGSAEEIEKVLEWAGLKPDESPRIGGSFGPYKQSERLNIYQERVNELLESGRAYRCFCSIERLELLRKHQSKNREKPRYDGKCRNLSQLEVKEKLESIDNQHTIRFALQPGIDKFDDMIFGEISNNLLDSKEGDPIIIKSDKYPTYHFANVVDDHQMQISHVLRGSEWLASTTKHVQLYKAFGWNPPTFAHFPLITMRDGLKMSKRNNESHVQSWIKAGFSPLAILNFLTTMGGGMPKEKQDRMDIWNLESIIQHFDFKNVTCHPSSVDLQRLNKFNMNDLRKSWSENAQEVVRRSKVLLSDKTDLDDDSLKVILDRFMNGRIVTLNDLVSPENSYIWKYIEPTQSLQKYFDKDLNLKQILIEVIKIVNETGIEDRTSLESRMKSLAKNSQIEYSALFRFLRIILTNSDKGLPVYEIFSCLGQARLLDYLNRGIKHIESLTA